MAVCAYFEARGIYTKYNVTKCECLSTAHLDKVPEILCYSYMTIHSAFVGE